MITEGTLKVKGFIDQVSEKFKKREFILTIKDGQYEQHVSFQLTQDKCGLLDSYKVGDEIKVHFNLNGKAWTNPQGETKYFNSLTVWKIEFVRSDETSEAAIMNTEPSEDLPF